MSVFLVGFSPSILFMFMGDRWPSSLPYNLTLSWPYYVNQKMETAGSSEMVVIQPTNTWHYYLQTGSVSQIHARSSVDFLSVLFDDTCIQMVPFCI